jgi:indole-3-glycerol phosphate synthase
MTILDRIVADTRTLVARRKREMPASALECLGYFNSPVLPLERALRGGDVSFIAEIKQASPSKGRLRDDFDVCEIARQYKMAGAAAISVLTEPSYFQGALAHLAAVRSTVDLPLLRKDFVIDPYQLVEARAYGADAVLLIATVLDAVQLRDLHEAATGLGLSCLVEVYDLAELDRIDFDQVCILGVNNRDLHTFSVDLARSTQVFAEVPDSVVRVSESGLRSAIEIADLWRDGVDAVLIGETFMRCDEPGAALKNLREGVRSIVADGRAPLRLVG